MTIDHDAQTHALAELAVGLGANVQPGQIVTISSEPGKEELARAIAEARVRARARSSSTSPCSTCTSSAPGRCTPTARRSATSRRGSASGCWRSASTAPRGSRCPGRSAPRALDDVDPELIGLDMLPRVPESMKVVNDAHHQLDDRPLPDTRPGRRSCTPGWSRRPHSSGCGRRSRTCAVSTSPIPSRPGRAGSSELKRVSGALTELRLDRIRFEGPGTDLSIGLLPSSHWLAAKLRDRDGIDHQPNLPTEEVFTTPDPERVEGDGDLDQAAVHVRNDDHRAAGHASRAGARSRSMPTRAPRSCAGWSPPTRARRGWARWRSSTARAGSGRWGRCSTTRCSTRTRPATSRSGHGYQSGVDDDAEAGRASTSREIHTDFMIGSDEVSVTGVCPTGRGPAAARRQLADLSAQHGTGNAGHATLGPCPERCRSG